MNSKIKAFAFISVALMIGGAFFCCSVVDVNSSADRIDLYCDGGTDYNVQYNVGDYVDIHFYCDCPNHARYQWNSTPAGINVNSLNNEFSVFITGCFQNTGVYTLTINPTCDCGYSHIVFTVTNAPTVSFNANGGTCPIPSSTVNSGSVITLPSATKEYYSFSGWYTAASGGTRVGGAGDSYTVTADTTLYAQYNVIPVSITTSQATAYVNHGSSFAYTVGTNPSDATITVSGADWLTVSGKTVTGVPTSVVTPGTYHVTVTAHYGTQTDVQSFDVVVVQKLTFESIPTGGIIAVPA